MVRSRLYAVGALGLGLSRILIEGSSEGVDESAGRDATTATKEAARRDSGATTRGTYDGGESTSVRGSPGGKRYLLGRLGENGRGSGRK